MSLLLWKNILEAAFETLHDNLKPAQCDALCALFQPKESRWREAHFLTERLVRHVAPLLLEKGGELLVQWGLHPLDGNENPFRIRNIWLDPSDRCGLLLITPPPQNPLISGYSKMIAQVIPLPSTISTPPHMKMKTSITPALPALLLVTLLFQSSLCFADLFEDQLNQLKEKKTEAVTEINRKYAEHLNDLLAKVRANKDGAMDLKIRQELLNAGFPDKADWIAGEWESLDSERNTRGYVFDLVGTAKHHKFNGVVVRGPALGNYTMEPDGSVKAIMGTSLYIITKTKTGITVLRWNNAKDYPDKTKAVTGIAKRVL